MVFGWRPLWDIFTLGFSVIPGKLRQLYSRTQGRKGTMPCLTLSRNIACQSSFIEIWVFIREDHVKQALMSKFTYKYPVSLSLSVCRTCSYCCTQSLSLIKIRKPKSFFSTSFWSCWSLDINPTEHVFHLLKIRWQANNPETSKKCRLLQYRPGWEYSLRKF